MNQKFYIAYGANLNVSQMRKRCPTAKLMGTAMLKDYQLLFRGAATIVPNFGRSVPIAIWELDKQCERTLDQYEGFPKCYSKKTLPVELNGQIIMAFAYVMNVGEPMLPNKAYFEAIKTGYSTMRLPIQYLYNAIQYTKEQILLAAAG